jgi:hypothetical protein
MSKPPLFDISSLKTIVQGAIGAMTFGAYHQFVTNKIMELNNEKMEIQHKTDLVIQELKHKEEMKVFQEKLEKLEEKIKSKSSWW